MTAIGGAPAATWQPPGINLAPSGGQAACLPLDDAAVPRPVGHGPPTRASARRDSGLTMRKSDAESCILICFGSAVKRGDTVQARSRAERSPRRSGLSTNRVWSKGASRATRRVASRRVEDDVGPGLSGDGGGAIDDAAILAVGPWLLSRDRSARQSSTFTSPPSCRIGLARTCTNRSAACASLATVRRPRRLGRVGGLGGVGGCDALALDEGRYIHQLIARHCIHPDREGPWAGGTPVQPRARAGPADDHPPGGASMRPRHNCRGMALATRAAPAIPGCFNEALELLPGNSGTATVMPV